MSYGSIEIRNNPDYKTTKQTVLAFVIALKLNLEQAEKLLNSDGFVLSNAILGDVIVKFFVEKGYFDLSEVNNYLDEYEQTLIGDKAL